MIEASLEISLIVLFLHACTWDGMIFEFVKNWIDPEKKISKPIYGCPICMTPWWGSAIYFVIFRGYEYGYSEWFTTVLGAAGISVLWVVAIDLKDYAVSRTRGKESCCVDYEEETNSIVNEDPVFGIKSEVKLTGSGEVKNIVITSPGSGYTSDPVDAERWKEIGRAEIERMRSQNNPPDKQY